MKQFLKISAIAFGVSLAVICSYFYFNLNVTTTPIIPKVAPDPPDYMDSAITCTFVELKSLSYLNRNDTKLKNCNVSKGLGFYIDREDLLKLLTKVPPLGSKDGLVFKYSLKDHIPAGPQLHPIVYRIEYKTDSEGTRIFKERQAQDSLMRVNILCPTDCDLLKDLDEKH